MNDTQKADKVNDVVDAIHDIIVAAGVQRIPSGHLYAMLMSYMALDTYQNVIALMMKTRGVTLKNHVLHAAL